MQANFCDSNKLCLSHFHESKSTRHHCGLLTLLLKVICLIYLYNCEMIQHNFIDLVGITVKFDLVAQGSMFICNGVVISYFFYL